MSKKQDKVDNGIVAVKSKFDADIIRFSMNRNEPMSYEDFGKLLAQRHDLGTDFSFSIWYTDTDGDLLPINNDNNLARALANAKCLLRIFIHRKGKILRLYYILHARCLGCFLFRIFYKHSIFLNIYVLNNKDRTCVNLFKPANQRAALTAPRRGSFSRNSQLSSGSRQSTQSAGSDEEADEIVDLTGMTMQDDASASSTQHHHYHHHHHHQNYDQGVLHL
ncbi:Partitioning defective 6 like protein gamma [Cyphomyrmex costatus]|uniref:Partitioning defective 6 like protein gamma n=1 Tax=Cyphomyrmex costatus TaxID=456900 RepID=A0A195CRE4_9HYME|nr:Partitioning defective 6 like protein gamma [Cyphomyrmex costatus]